MNYELAQALKDAGFPQILGRDFIYPSGRIICSACQPFTSEKGLCAYPTLEELIEACNGNRRNFILQHHMGKYNGWTATKSNVTSKKCPTPIEAVAMLYLALYGKKHNNKDKGEASRMEGE